MLIILIMLYVTSLVLIYLLIGNLYLLIIQFSFPRPPPSPTLFRTCPVLLGSPILPGHQNQVHKVCPLCGLHELPCCGWTVATAAVHWLVGLVPQWASAMAVVHASGRGYYSAGCQAQLRCWSGWGFQQSVPTGANRLE